MSVVDLFFNARNAKSIPYANFGLDTRCFLQCYEPSLMGAMFAHCQTIAIKNMFLIMASFGKVSRAAVSKDVHATRFPVPSSLNFTMKKSTLRKANQFSVEFFLAGFVCLFSSSKHWSTSF